MYNELYNSGYDDAIRQNPVLSPEEEKELFLTLRKTGSSEVRKKIICSNFRLVIDNCAKYRNLLKNSLLFDDLVEAGNEGLIKAVDKFDSSYNCKFSTYATRLILREIYEFIYSERYRGVHQPSRFGADKKLYSKVVSEYYKIYNRKPDCNEIALMTNLTVERVKFIEKYSELFISLDSPLLDNSDVCLSDTISDYSFLVEEQVENNDLRRIYMLILDSMNINDTIREMFILRYGLDGNGKRKLKPLAKKYGVSHQAVCQSLNNVLNRIKRSYSYLFEGYISDDKIKTKRY